MPRRLSETPCKRITALPFDERGVKNQPFNVTPSGVAREALANPSDAVCADARTVCSSWGVAGGIGGWTAIQPRPIPPKTVPRKYKIAADRKSTSLNSSHLGISY